MSHRQVAARETRTSPSSHSVVPVRFVSRGLDGDLVARRCGAGVGARKSDAQATEWAGRIVRRDLEASVRQSRSIARPTSGR